MIVTVIPSYNEGNRLKHAAESALQYSDAVVVVDDGSKDGSHLKVEGEHIHVLQHPLNRGQGAAIQTGQEYALALGAEYIVHFDADGQMDAQEIPDLIAALEESEAGIALGSRFLGKSSNMPLSRRMTLWLSKLFTWLTSGLRVSDAHCGFRALTSEAASKTRFTLDRMAHASEVYDLIHIHRIPYVEVPVTITYTEESLAKGMSFLDGFKVLREFFSQKFFG
jgi:glycosyltransferase involved in cell wall biosynthesis